MGQGSGFDSGAKTTNPLTLTLFPTLDLTPNLAGGGMGERRGSGVLNPLASSFIPRSVSGGSDVFLTPAPSLASATAIADLTPEQACRV